MQNLQKQVRGLSQIVGIRTEFLPIEGISEGIVAEYVPWRGLKIPTESLIKDINWEESTKYIEKINKITKEVNPGIIPESVGKVMFLVERATVQINAPKLISLIAKSLFEFIEKIQTLVFKAKKIAPTKKYAFVAILKLAKNIKLEVQITLTKIQKEDLKEWYKDHESDMTLIVIGDVLPMEATIQFFRDQTSLMAARPSNAEYKKYIKEIRRKTNDLYDNYAKQPRQVKEQYIGPLQAFQTSLVDFIEKAFTTKSGVRNRKVFVQHPGNKRLLLKLVNLAIEKIVDDEDNKTKLLEWKKEIESKK